MVELVLNDLIAGYQIIQHSSLPLNHGPRFFGLQVFERLEEGIGCQEHGGGGISSDLLEMHAKPIAGPFGWQ